MLSQAGSTLILTSVSDGGSIGGCEKPITSNEGMIFSREMFFSLSDQLAADLWPEAQGFLSLIQLFFS